jgi:hypothetical protein
MYLICQHSGSINLMDRIQSSSTLPGIEALIVQARSPAAAKNLNLAHLMRGILRSEPSREHMPGKGGGESATGGGGESSKGGGGESSNSGGGGEFKNNGRGGGEAASKGQVLYLGTFDMIKHSIPINNLSGAVKKLSETMHYVDTHHFCAGHSTVGINQESTVSVRQRDYLSSSNRSMTAHRRQFR